MGLWDFFGSLLGNVASSGLSAISTAAAQRRQYEYSQKLQNSQNLFTSWMSNTAHQREVADLQAAGLNPVLSAKLGGASTPSGAEGDYSDPDTNALMGALKTVSLNAGTSAKASRSSLTVTEPKAPVKSA